MPSPTTRQRASTWSNGQMPNDSMPQDGPTDNLTVTDSKPLEPPVAPYRSSWPSLDPVSTWATAGQIKQPENEDDEPVGPQPAHWQNVASTHPIPVRHVPFAEPLMSPHLDRLSRPPPATVESAVSRGSNQRLGDGPQVATIRHIQTPEPVVSSSLDRLNRTGPVEAPGLTQVGPRPSTGDRGGLVAERPSK